MITKTDIIFLYETWASAKTDLKLSGYISHNFHRCIQIEEPNVTAVVLQYSTEKNYKMLLLLKRNIHNTMIWLKLDKS